MKDEIITFETAKLAKEKGFDEICEYLWSGSGDEPLFSEKIRNHNTGLNHNREWYSQTTQSLLQKWLREEHNLHIGISVNQFGYGLMYSIINTKDCKCVSDLKGGVNDKFSYEEALEAGLIAALKLI